LAGTHLVESQPFQLWCDQWAARLERLHRRSRRACIEQRVAARDLEAALAHARAWIRMDPLEDEAQHHVLDLLTRLGRSDDALREYDTFCALLAREGLEPLEQTRALMEEMRARGRRVPVMPAADTAGDGAGPPSPTSGARGARSWKTRARLLLPLAAVIATAALVPLVLGHSSTSSLERERVMVLPLENETGDSTLSDIGLLAADWITNAVAHMGTLDAVPFLHVRQMMDAGLPPEEAAAHRLAGTLVSGRYFRVGDSLQLHVRITDVGSGELWDAVDPVRLSPASPEAGLREMRDRVAGSLGVRFTPASALPDPSALDPPSYPAFKALMDAAAFISRNDWTNAIQPLQRAVSLDTTFDRARLGLVAAYMNIGQFVRADSLLRDLAPRRDRFSPYERLLFRGLSAAMVGDHARQLAAAREAARIDPGGTVHYISGDVALAAGRPREALALTSTLDPECPWAPGWLGPWSNRTAAYHLLGRHRRELEEARRALTLHPDRLPAAFFELRALAALGRVDAVSSGLAQAERLAPEPGWDYGRLLRTVATELRVHGHAQAADTALDRAVAWYRHRSPEERAGTAQRVAYARALLAAGRLPEAAEVLDTLRAEAPDRLDVLGLAGILAARRDDPEVARQLSAALEDRRAPYQFGRVDYWRAAIAAWLGHREEAVALLRHAIAEGWPQGIQLHADPAFRPLWSLPAFRLAVAEPS
ncbi:MAG: BTAD domain-containing putative transcriptional regulator, partial [Gemmatimonadota bacterium]